MATPYPRDRRLRDAGFTYDERLDVWFNLDTGRALSGATIWKNTEEWLTAWLAGRERAN